jgi:hypothetical protein
VALTATQKANVRRFLGYADVSQGRYSDLEGLLVSLSAEAETQIIAILTDLATIETSLRASWGRQSVTRVEDVHLAGPGEIGALRSEGNRLAKHLSTIIGAPVLQLPFASSGGGFARRG